MLEVSTLLRDTFSPDFTTYGIESVQLEKYLGEIELDIQLLNISPSEQSTLLNDIRSDAMEFQQEKHYRDEIVREVEALGKSLTKVWTRWAVYARDCAKRMTIDEAKHSFGNVSSNGGGGLGGGVSKADLERIQRNAEREAARARRAAGRVASKKALEETQKEVEATAKRLAKAVKNVKDHTDDVATVVKRLEEEFLRANHRAEILSNGLDSAKNDIIELKNSAMHMQHDIEETRNMIPEPTPPYDDSEIKHQLNYHAKELVDIIDGVNTLKESEGKFDAEIKSVFEEHAQKIAHLLATKADARSTELALKSKAPRALEHQVKDFVRDFVEKINDRDQLSQKKSKTQRASLEARILKLVTASLNRLKAQQNQLSQIIGPFNSRFGGLMYKCLACDRPADNYMPLHTTLHNHRNRILTEESKSAGSLSGEFSDSLTVSPMLGGKGVKEVAVRKYGGKVNAREDGKRKNEVNFDDPGIQARRNIHTYSPYRTVGAGFRVNNKTHRAELQKDLFLCNSPDISRRKRPQTAPHGVATGKMS